MASDDPKELLRKHGYKATGARLAVLNIFQKAKHPLSAQEVIAILPRSARTDQATVYRTLASFKQKGLIRPVDLRHNHAHYERNDAHDHHHLVCLRCGRVEDVHRCGIEDMQASVLRTSRHFAEIKQHALEFYGLCKSCTAKTGTPKPVIE